MLSILIPVYNWNVVQLVKELHRQCTLSGIDYEIRCYEDGSEAEYVEKNKMLEAYEGIIYRILEQNIGRSRIRNLLAEEAEYPFLLFLDCDSGIADKQFIQNYLELIRVDTVLYGGRIYAEQRPAEKTLQLHWLYGHYRESAPAPLRQESPYHRFMTNNFLIPKSVFNQIRFEERLLQYGHEDTLFGQELQARKVPILHLDNPVVHLGFEDTAVFLEKNRQAVENLCFLAREHPALDTSLLRTARQLKKYKLDQLALMVLRSMYPSLYKNLLSAQPRMRALDLFKLYHFLNYDQ